MKEEIIFYEEDLLNFDSFEKTLDNMETIEELKNFLGKLSFAFFSSDLDYKRKMLFKFMNKYSERDFRFFLKIGRESYFGNVIILLKFVQDFGIINAESFDYFLELKTLEFIEEEIFDYCERGSVSLDVEVTELKLASKNTALNLIFLLELFLSRGILISTKAVYITLMTLYKSHSNIGADKSSLYSSLLEQDAEKFIICLKKYDINFQDLNYFLNNYSKAYNLLLKNGIFVSFFVGNIKSNGEIYNNNFYPMRYIDSSGEERVLMPFAQVDKNRVKKIYDLVSESYVFSSNFSSKLTISDIFSFEKVKTFNEEILPVDIELVKEMSEKEIISRFSKIIHEMNEVPHGPAELADLLTGKIYINNSLDNRDSAFVFKGKSFKAIKPTEVAHQFLKAARTSAKILFFVYTGDILDEVREEFIQVSAGANKPYCFIDLEEITRIFKAYHLLID